MSVITDPNALHATVHLNMIEIQRQAQDYCEEFQGIRHEVNLIRTPPDYQASIEMLDRMKGLINGAHYRALGDRVV